MSRLARSRRPLAALFAAAAAWLALLALRPGPPPAVRVLAAARDLPAGATLAPSDVRPVSLPPESVPSGALRADAAGRVLAGPMRRGEPLTDVRVIGDRLLRGYGPDKVATPIRIADADTARLLRPGDRIDVLAAPPTSPHGETPMPAPFAPTHQSTPAPAHPPPPAQPASAHMDAPVRTPPARLDAPAPPQTAYMDVPAPTSAYAEAAAGPQSAHADAPARGVGGSVGGFASRTAVRGDGAPWGSARVVASAVPVIAVPTQDQKGTRDGALIVLATSRSQASALAGARTDLSVTITT
ncbi:SAF domain-containing protein [Actinomadura algeriensis]|uniref:SAF domain-containing protein n=1 Tax=Actinomadura algeriensis TaxID=1679523 RepID=A0ABR9JTP5_9ACTN|nr:SAF domain-containing protein [Actinomadura algeriensis]MBE1533933.1 hypothetical protein [Actinomadura algeriensis]